MPGSPLDPRAQGCNQLIRDGATLVQTAATSSRNSARSKRECAQRRQAISRRASAGERRRRCGGPVGQLLGPSPVPVDELIRLSGASSGAVQMALLELDLAGRLERHAGGKVSLPVA